MADVTIRDPKTGEIVIHTNDETCITEIKEELLKKKKRKNKKQEDIKENN